MDAESLAQIEQIVTTAVGGTEERLRKEITDAVSLTEGRLRKEITSAVNGTEGRLRNEMQAASASLKQEFNERLNEKFEEAERHSGALFEEALHRIDLVVEGHQALFQKIEHIEARMEDGFAKIEHEFLEVRS